MLKKSISYSTKIIYIIFILYGIKLFIYGLLYLLPLALIFIIPSVIALVQDDKVEKRMYQKKDISAKKYHILKSVILVAFFLFFYIMGFDLADLVDLILMNGKIRS